MENLEKSIGKTSGDLKSSNIDRVDNEQEKIAKIVSIDRSKPFNVEEYLGEGWSIYEEDSNALNIDNVNMNDIVLRSEKTEKGRVRGKDQIYKLKEDNSIRMDINFFKTLFENQELIPEEWKDGSKAYFFDGSVLKSPKGDRFTMVLKYLDDEKKWNNDRFWVEFNRDENDLSVCYKK